jgi:hypothetical protein
MPEQGLQGSFFIGGGSGGRERGDGAHVRGGGGGRRIGSWVWASDHARTYGLAGSSSWGHQTERVEQRHEGNRL